MLSPLFHCEHFPSLALESSKWWQIVDNRGIREGSSSLPVEHFFHLLAQGMRGPIMEEHIKQFLVKKPCKVFFIASPRKQVLANCFFPIGVASFRVPYVVKLHILCFHLPSHVSSRLPANFSRPPKHCF